MSISSSIRLFGAALCLLLAGLVALSLGVLGHLEISGPLYHRIDNVQKLAGDIEPPPLYVVEAYLDVNLAIAHPDQAETMRTALHQLESDYRARHAYWARADLADNISAEVRDSSDAQVQRFWTIVDRQVLPDIANGNDADLPLAMGALDAAFNAHRAIVNDVVAKAEASYAANTALAARQIRLFTWVMYSAAGGVLALVVAGLWLITRRVVAPITGMATYMAALAEGDYDRSVPYAGRRDEVGAMARAVEVFRQALAAQARAQAALAAAQATQAAERARHEAAREAAAAVQETVVQGLAGALQRFAGGDLTVQLADEFDAGYERLRADFNQAAAHLRTAMRRIGGAARDVQGGAGDITAAADDLAGRTERQAATLEEAAAALAHLTESLRASTEQARQAAALAGGAHEVAARSGTVVAQAVNAMQGIETSSHRISNIIGVIDEIAFQTNLLALNAGVEAARAGEAGRGFAVVATEVRALAQRSADAAREIKTIIAESTAQVGEGVRLVGETGGVLAQISTEVTALSALVERVAAASETEAGSLRAVSTTISQMDQVTQANAAMVEQTTAAARTLAATADELARLVAAFRTGPAPQLASVRRQVRTIGAQ